MGTDQADRKRLTELGLTGFLRDQEECWRGNDDGGDTENADYCALLANVSARHDRAHQMALATNRALRAEVKQANRRLCAALSAQGLAESRLAALREHASYCYNSREWGFDVNSQQPEEFNDFADALRAHTLGIAVEDLPERKAEVPA